MATDTEIDRLQNVAVESYGIYVVAPQDFRTAHGQHTAVKFDDYAVIGFETQSRLSGRGHNVATLRERDANVLQKFA